MRLNVLQLVIQRSIVMNDVVQVQFSTHLSIIGKEIETRLWFRENNNTRVDLKSINKLEAKQEKKIEKGEKCFCYSIEFVREQSG